MLFFETSRLIIRPFSMNDLLVVHRILDIELQDSDFGTEGTLNASERERWLQWTILNYEQLAKLNQPPFGNVAIEFQKEVIGVCGFVPCLDAFEQLCAFDQASPSIHPSLNTSEFGLFYAIAKDYQGQGFGTEAASAMISYAFEILRVKRIIVTTSYDNAPSIGIMKNLGMQLKRNPCATPSWLQVVGVLENPLALSI